MSDLFFLDLRAGSPGWVANAEFVRTFGGTLASGNYHFATEYEGNPGLG